MESVSGRQINEEMRRPHGAETACGCLRVDKVVPPQGTMQTGGRSWDGETRWSVLKQRDASPNPSRARDKGKGDAGDTAQR